MFVDTSSRLKIGIDLTFIELNFVRGEKNIRISFIFETVTLNILREEIKTLFFFYNLQFVENVSKIKLHSKIIFYESSRLSGKESHPSLLRIQENYYPRQIRRGRKRNREKFRTKIPDNDSENFFPVNVEKI